MQFRSLKGLSLKESLAQFSSSMTAQTDLRVEYAHLKRFFTNFASVRESVTPPLPIPGMCTEAVLVETYEPGAAFLSSPISGLIWLRLRACLDATPVSVFGFETLP
jgi:predicted unusual protein kinase regulating ubiquinone biosynthesis (AarF/ABC1/UbiB family)